MRAVVKYEVRKELEPIDPMYGRSRLLGEYDDLDKAVAKGKTASKTMSYVSVMAIVYACKENYEKRFSYDGKMIWHEDMEDWQIENSKAWVEKTAELFERYT